MSKAEFLYALREALREKNIRDIDEILEEYEQHFAFKLSGRFFGRRRQPRVWRPCGTRGRYEAESPRSAESAAGSLPWRGSCGWMFFPVPCSSISFLPGSLSWLLPRPLCGYRGCTRTPKRAVRDSPPMPYFVAFFRRRVLCLSALAAVGTCYCWDFARQLCRCYARFHKNTLSVAPAPRRSRRCGIPAVLRPRRADGCALSRLCP
jgi:hypothetical protein